VLLDFNLELYKRPPRKVFEYSVYNSEGRYKALRVCGWCELFSFAGAYAHSPTYSTNAATFTAAVAGNLFL